MKSYATYVRNQINLASKEARRLNALSQESRRNERLERVLKHGTSRSMDRVLLGQLAWYNAISKQHTLFEIYHEPSDGSGKFTVYVNGDRWRNGWSKTRFIKMLSRKIDGVTEGYQ